MRPPRLDRVFWVLLGMTAIWQIIAALYEPTVTLGEILGLSATVLLALAAGLRVALIKCLRAYPFQMLFITPSPFLAHRRGENPIYRTVFEGRLGPQEIYLEIKTHHAISQLKFDVRFVEKKFIWFGPTIPAQLEFIEIKRVSTPVLEKDQNIHGANQSQDEYGGVVISYADKAEWVIGEPLYVGVEINVKKSWRGYISFRAQTDRRAITRRRVKFRE